MITVDVAYAGLVVSGVIVLAGLVVLIFLDVPAGKRFAILALIFSLIGFGFAIGQYSGSTYHGIQPPAKAATK